MRPYLIILFFNFNMINSMAAHGRSPAVEPEVSLELDYQSDSQPENVKRYNFDQRQPSATEEPMVEIKVQLPPMEEALPDQSSGLEGGLLLFIFLLPVLLVYGVNKLLSRKLGHGENHTNVVALKTDKQKNDDDNMNLPKAS